MPQLGRFAGDHGRHMLPHDPFVLVKDPRHGLLVGVNIRGRDVLERPDVVRNGPDVSARHQFEIMPGELQGIDNNAALGAAEGDVHDRTLESHQERELAGMLRAHLGMEANAALGRSACVVVLYAVSREHPGLSR